MRKRKKNSIPFLQKTKTALFNKRIKKTPQNVCGVFFDLRISGGEFVNTFLIKREERNALSLHIL